MLEKAVLSQLLGHIENNNLSEIFQSAYKKNHSTETALLKITSDILNDVDNKNVCLLTLLDLSAAFDTIDHNILLKRLELTFGIRGMALKWFKSYLTERYQSVSIGNENSSDMPLRYGVPQGSVLGPVLFTLYTQPLVNILYRHGMKYHFYADDTQLYKSGPVDCLPDLIQTTTTCVEQIKIWMTSNKLRLNENKTEIMLVHSARCKQPPEFSLCVNGNVATPKEKVKNLGVVLDHNLSMSSHVTSLCQSMYFQLRRIASIRNFIPDDVAKTLVTSLILSKLDYCNSLLAGIPQESLNRLQLVQNNAARLVSKTKKSDHITPVLRDLHWLPVRHRIVFKVCTIVFKCINNHAPLYLKNLLQKYHQTRALRSANDVTRLSKPERNYKYLGCRSLSHFGPLVWNQLPSDIRECMSLDSFKKALKHHLFMDAYDV